MEVAELAFNTPMIKGVDSKLWFDLFFPCSLWLSISVSQRVSCPNILINIVCVNLLERDELNSWIKMLLYLYRVSILYIRLIEIKSFLLKIWYNIDVWNLKLLCNNVTCWWKKYPVHIANRSLNQEENRW